MDIDSVAESRLQQSGSPNGSTRTPGGLQPPERSGSPDLERRSSQRGPDWGAYTFRDDAHQGDDWPRADDRQLEDVLVRYKKTTTSKGLKKSRTDTHVWLDLETDTEDEEDEKATCFDIVNWNCGINGTSPSPASLHVGAKVSLKQTRTKVSRSRGGLLKQTEEAEVYCLDYRDGSSESSDEEQADSCVDGVPEQEGDRSSVGEEETLGSVQLAPPVATIVAMAEGSISVTQDNRIPPTAHLCDEERGAGVVELRGESHLASMACQDNVPDNLSDMNYLQPHGTNQTKSEDEAIMKMSRRYYANSGKEPSHPKRNMSGRSSSKSVERGRDEKPSSRERKKKGEILLKAVNRSQNTRVAPGGVQTVKELVESPTSSSQESDGSEMRIRKGDAGCCKQDDHEQGLRQMILEKYLVVKRAKQRTSQAKLPASPEIKQKEEVRKTQATSPSRERKPTGKNLRQKSPLKQRSQGPPKNVCQPETRLSREQAILARNSQQTVLPGKSSATGDWPHSKSLGGESYPSRDDTLRQEEAVSYPENSAEKEQETHSIDPQTGSGGGESTATVRELPHTEITLDESCLAEDIDQRHEEVLCHDPQIAEKFRGQAESEPQASPLKSSSERGMAAQRTLVSKEEAESLDALRLCLTGASENQKAPTKEPSHGSPTKEPSHGGIFQRLSAMGGRLKASTSQQSSPSKAPDQRNGEHGAHEAAVSGEGSITSSSSRSISIPTLRPTALAEEGGDQAQRQSPSSLETVEAPKHVNGAAEADEYTTGLSNRKLLEIMKKVTAAVPFEPREDDEILPALSLAVQPASFKLSVLQKKVEELKHQVADERRQRQVVAQRLTEQRREAETVAQRKQEQWDLKFRELQKEKHALSMRLQSTETAHLASLLAGRGASKQIVTLMCGAPQRRLLPSCRPRESPKNLEVEAQQPRKLKASAEKVQPTEEEVQKLRQEILQQEVLIRGYQHENERAVGKLKEVQLESKEKIRVMAEENAILASQLANRHLQGGRQSWGYGSDAVSLKEKLQDALSREFTLRVELDKMRETHIELEKRFIEGESKRVNDLEVKVTALQGALAEERQGHAQTVSTMDGRMSTMLQQEELIASLQATIAEQAAQVITLTTRLQGCEAQGGTCQEMNWQTPSQAGQREGVRSDLAMKSQIEALQNQVKRLEASLKVAKKETGLPTLAQVSKPGMEESDKVRRLQAELVAVQRQAIQREEESNKTLHHLKIENDKLRHEAAVRIRNLKQQVQAQAQSGTPMSEAEMSAVNRAKDLEKQVANMRIHYSRKVKELSDKLEEAKLESFGRIEPQSRKQNPHLPGKELREARERIALQEDVLSQKDQTIRALHLKLREMGAGGKGAGNPSASGPSSAMVPSAAREKLRGGMSKVHNNKLQEKRHFQEFDVMPSNGFLQDSGMTNNSDQAADEVAALRKELEKSEMTREMLQKACDESVEKTVLLTLQHQQALQLQHMHQSQARHNADCQQSPTRWNDSRGVSEGLHWMDEGSSLEMTNRALEARLKVMSEELEEVHAVCRQSPRMAQISSLKKKVAEMEARQQQKEKEWQMLVQGTKRVRNMEQDFADRKWQQALVAKSAEVEQFRHELDAILEAAVAMQQSQIQANPMS